MAKGATATTAAHAAEVVASEFDGEGGAVGHAVDADGAGEETAAGEVVEDGGEVLGFLDAESDELTGGIAVAAEVDEDGAVAGFCRDWA